MAPSFDLMPTKIHPEKIDVIASSNQQVLSQSVRGTRNLSGIVLSIAQLLIFEY